MGNNSKMIENYVRKIWVKNVVILGWFPFLEGFRAYDIFFRYVHFLTVLMENNNKMTEKDGRMVWVQKKVIMCWFVTFESYCA